MILSNIKVYDLEEAIIASGYPMRTDSPDSLWHEVSEKDFTRAKNLVKLSLTNGAHAQFLTGVRVSMDVTFSNKAWIEAERYRFLEFVSSQSTMHRITKFDLKGQCNKYVDDRIIDIVRHYVDEYNRLSNLPGVSGVVAKPRKETLDELYLKILYNIPSGFQLTARVTTNYRCLLNIYNQRHDHRLPEWREFCEELKQLPYFTEFLSAYMEDCHNKYEVIFRKNDEICGRYTVNANNESDALSLANNRFYSEHKGHYYHTFEINSMKEK